MSPASWGHRKARGTVSVHVRRPGGVYKPRSGGRRGQAGLAPQSGREREADREGENSPFPYLFGLFKALSGVGEAHPHWGRPSACLSLAFKGQSLAETPSSHVEPGVWEVRLTVR